MAKGRMLLKRISLSEKINSLSNDTARLLYTWMLAHLDKNGCFYADPTLVENIVFPWRKDISDKQILSHLDEMEALNLIKRYSCSGDYLCYPDFEEKQPYLRKDKEGREDIPPYTPELVGTYSNKTTTQSKIKESKVKYNKPTIPNSNGVGKRFEEFWSLYNKKLERDICYCWYVKNGNEETHCAIMEGIKRWKDSGNWIEIKYQPKPINFLEKKKWLDEPIKIMSKEELDREQATQRFLQGEKP